MIPPLANLKFALAVGAVVLGLSSSHLLDGPSEIDAAQATEAARQDALNDALAAAQAERPELWTAEQKQRARVAAALVAREVQP